MNVSELQFHHLGLAVKSPQQARLFLQGLGYTIGEVVYDPLQKVNLIYCVSETQPHVELIFPADEPGPLGDMLKSRDSLIYHICYSVKCISKALTSLKETGLRVMPVADPQPACLFNNANVGFYYVRGFGLIELVENK
jgi:hypothetical protein